MRNGLVLKRGKIHRLVKASKERSLCPFIDDLHGQDLDEMRIGFVASSFFSPCAGCGWYSNVAGAAL